ncbi:hypothetical protein A8F94_00870 [Bacillus sp. FJAT-27225]|uniref:hypothetical protein n=1 Tax=Bacillus sp. FJAT-27225 TaxID=1743144 RepID=UPI00080C2F75|nr:hypothetical protein [Bacillus sp. FJAT-27225]OCA90475.1 hypothetical protein A8F94_00870 [Bacillus sp. FJAT-27225]
MKRKVSYIILLLLPGLFFAVDLNLAKVNKPPLFVITTAMYKDGGTKEYKGLGYKVIDYNELDGEGRQDVVFVSPFFKVGQPK